MRISENIFQQKKIQIATPDHGEAETHLRATKSKKKSQKNKKKSLKYKRTVREQGRII